MITAKPVGDTSTQLKLFTGKKQYAEISDYDLVLACKNHEQKAFEQLIKRNQRYVYGLLHHLAPDCADTRDMAQEVFIRVWRSLDNLRNAHSFKTWLHHIVTNLFYDELRRRPRQAIVYIDEPILNENSDETPTRDLADASGMPDEVVQRRELSAAIARAISRLPDQFRTTILLRELQGLSYEEIASITHAEPGTVKSRIARARAKMQTSLLPYMEDCA